MGCENPTCGNGIYTILLFRRNYIFTTRCRQRSYSDTPHSCPQLSPHGGLRRWKETFRRALGRTDQYIWELFATDQFRSIAEYLGCRGIQEQTPVIARALFS